MTIEGIVVEAGVDHAAAAPSGFEARWVHLLHPGAESTRVGASNNKPTHLTVQHVGLHPLTEVLQVPECILHTQVVEHAAVRQRGRHALAIETVLQPEHHSAHVTTVDRHVTVRGAIGRPFAVDVQHSEVAALPCGVINKPALLESTEGGVCVADQLGKPVDSRVAGPLVGDRAGGR